MTTVVVILLISVVCY